MGEKESGLLSECAICGKDFSIETPHYMIELTWQKQNDTEEGIETEVIEVKAGWTICEQCGRDAEERLKKIFGESVIEP